MAAAAPVAGRIVLRRLAIPVGELAGWAVAFGLIFLMDAWIRGMVAIIRAVVGKVPFLGDFAANKAAKLGQVISGYLGAAEDRIEHKIAGCLHDLAQVFIELSNDIVETARALDRISRAVAKSLPGPILLRRLTEDRKRIAHAQRTADRAFDLATDNAIALSHPTKGKGAVSTKVATRPLAQRIGRLERSTDARLDALEHARARAVPVAVPHTGTIAYPGRREVERLWKTVRRHERLLAGGVGLGIVVRALAKLRLGWLRCWNVRNAGQAVCRMDARRLASLLDDSLLIVGTISIVELARELGSATELVSDAVHGFIREA